jgi:hypothetical protein
MTCFSG